MFTLTPDVFLTVAIRRHVLADCDEQSHNTRRTQVRSVRDVGLDYAITLRAWRAAWEEKKAAVVQLGYSERFWRKYRHASLLVPIQHTQHYRERHYWPAGRAALLLVGCTPGGSLYVLDGRGTPLQASIWLSLLPCRFYFAYCEAAFDANYIHNYHILSVKDASVPAPVVPAPLFATGNAGGAIISSNPVTQVQLRS